jgi:hypothetical protein
MAEPTEPNKRAGETSEKKIGPGVFLPVQNTENKDERAPNKVNTPQTPGMSVDGLRPRKINLEGEKKKAVALEKATTLLRAAEDIEPSATKLFDEDIFGVIIAEMKDVKELLEKGEELTPEMERSITEGEEELEKIRIAIIQAADKERDAAIEQQNILDKIEILYEKREEYTPLKPFIESLQRVTIEQAPEKEEIISLYNELSWLADFAKIKEFAKNNNAAEIQKIDDKLYELTQKKMDVEALLLALEQENEELKRIVKEGEKQSENFKKLEDEAGKLKVLDTAILNLHAEARQNVQHAEKEFYKSPSDVSLTKFDNALIKLEEVISKMKESVVITVPEPTSTPSIEATPIHTSAEVASEENIPTSSEPETTTRYPDDISVPNISEDVHAKNLENKYRVKIDGKDIAVPWILLGTLNRYLAAFKDTANKEKDFSKAIELKDIVVNAIGVANFARADEYARALGKELDLLLKQEKEKTATEKDVTVPTTEEEVADKGTESSSPENSEEERRKVHWSTILPSYVRFEKETKRWAIKKGDEFIHMTPKEYSVWTPFMNALLQYRKFIVSKDDAYNYGDVVKKKDELLDALEKLDRERATVLAKDLTRQFDPMLDKAVVPEKEKTAARIQYEVRQSNLARLADEDAKALGDTTAHFAFIKEPQANISREYRIISRQSGDWVPLEEKDLVVVKLAHDVLTNFKNRASSTPECIQKKNEVLSYINDYNFDAAKTAAEEYLKEYSKAESFSTFAKKNPLRPKVSGSQPSPTIEKNNLTAGFTKEKEKFLQTEDLLSKRLPLITSPLEQAAFARIVSELKNLEKELSENPTRESLELFKAKHEHLVSLLNAKEKFLEKQFGKAGNTPSDALGGNTIVMRNKRLREDNAPTETLQERNNRLTGLKDGSGVEETQAVNNRVKLFEKHKKMFERNPALYRELYENENGAHDAMTESISAHLLANANIPPETEPERRKTILRNLVGETPREHLEGIAQRKHKLRGVLQELLVKNLHDTTSESYRAQKEALERELNLIKEEEEKYAKTVLNKYAKKPEPELENNSILNQRQTYNPSKDPSLDEENWGVNQNFKENENGEIVKIDNSKLTKEELEELYESQPIPKGHGTDQELVKKTILSESDYPNHGRNNGEIIMESPRNDRDGTEPPHALTNEDIGKIKNEIELEEQEKIRQEQETKERAREKLTRGTKLFESLVKKVKPTTTKQWFILGLATLGLGFGTAKTIGKIEQDKLEDRRLIDEIKKQSTWKNYVNEQVSKQFIQDFNGDSKLSYKELIVKYVPSFGINQNNPSTMDKFSNLVCKDVFSVLGANAGINDIQQREASDLINNLKEMMIAAKASLGTLYREADIQSGAIFGDMTIQQYYDAVSQEVEKAESERIRLQNIKR